LNLKALLSYVMDSCVKRMKQVFNKRMLVPVNSKESGLVLKVILSDLTRFQGAKGCLITKNGDGLVRPVNTNAVKKYFVKIKKLDKSRT